MLEIHQTSEVEVKRMTCYWEILIIAILYRIAAVAIVFHNHQNLVKIKIASPYIPALRVGMVLKTQTLEQQDSNRSSSSDI